MEQENRLTTELSASSHRSERHVGFELLRIVSMAMIVMMHMIGLSRTAAPSTIFTGCCMRSAGYRQTALLC